MHRSLQLVRILKDSVLIHWLILILVCVTVVFVYWPGAHGGLYFDDSHVLLQNPEIRLRDLTLDSLKVAANSFLAGGREISMLSFALNFYFFGDRILAFKLVNISLHLLCGLLLFLFMTKLVKSPAQRVCETAEKILFLYISLFAVVVWLLAPINLGSVLYLSQRMAILSFVFVAAGLYVHLFIRESRLPLFQRCLFGMGNVVLFTLLAYKSKENGILLPGYVLLVELMVFLRPTSSFAAWRERIGVRKIALILSMAAALLFLCVLLIWPVLEARLNYSGRDFSMAERVMTQFRALGFYLSQILVPNNAELSMWHDDIRVSKGLVSPPTTLLGLLMSLSLVMLAIVSWWRKPVIGLAILWFFLGHSLESTIFPLEMMHEHRNYFASFGVFLLVGYLIFASDRIHNYLKLGLVVAILGLNATVLYARSVIWSNDLVKAAHEAKYHPDSPLAQFSYARYLFQAAQNGDEESTFLAKDVMERNMKQDELTVANESLLLILSSVTPIESNPMWVDSAVSKLREKGYSAITSRAVSGLLEHLQQQRSTLPISLVRPIFDYLATTKDPRLITFSAIFESEVGKNYQEAMQLFERASDQSPQNATFATNLLRAQLKFRRFDQACALYQRITAMGEDQTILLRSQLEQAQKRLAGRCAESL